MDLINSNTASNPICKKSTWKISDSLLGQAIKLMNVVNGGRVGGD